MAPWWMNGGWWLLLMSSSPWLASMKSMRAEDEMHPPHDDYKNFFGKNLSQRKGRQRQRSIEWMSKVSTTSRAKATAAMTFSSSSRSLSRLSLLPQSFVGGTSMSSSCFAAVVFYPRIVFGGYCVVAATICMFQFKCCCDVFCCGNDCTSNVV